MLEVLGRQPFFVEIQDHRHAGGFAPELVAIADGDVATRFHEGAPGLGQLEEGGGQSRAIPAALAVDEDRTRGAVERRDEPMHVDRVWGLIRRQSDVDEDDPGTVGNGFLGIVPIVAGVSAAKIYDGADPLARDGRFEPARRRLRRTVVDAFDDGVKIRAKGDVDQLGGGREKDRVTGEL